MTHQEDMMLDAEDFGLKSHKPEAIFGGNSVKEAADIFMRVLKINLQLNSKMPFVQCRLSDFNFKKYRFKNCFC